MRANQIQNFADGAPAAPAGRSWAFIAGSSGKANGDVDITKPLIHRVKLAATNTRAQCNQVTTKGAKAEADSVISKKLRNTGAKEQKKTTVGSHIRNQHGGKQIPDRNVMHKTVKPGQTGFAHGRDRKANRGGHGRRGTSGRNNPDSRFEANGPLCVEPTAKPTGASITSTTAAMETTKREIPQTPVIKAAVYSNTALMSNLRLPSPQHETFRKAQTVLAVIPFIYQPSALAAGSISYDTRPKHLQDTAAIHTGPDSLSTSRKLPFTTYYPATRYRARNIIVAIPYALKSGTSMAPL